MRVFMLLRFLQVEVIGSGLIALSKKWGMGGDLL